MSDLCCSSDFCPKINIWVYWKKVSSLLPPREFLKLPAQKHVVDQSAKKSFKSFVGICPQKNKEIYQRQMIWHLKIHCCRIRLIWHLGTCVMSRSTVVSTTHLGTSRRRRRRGSTSWRIRWGFRWCTEYTVSRVHCSIETPVLKSFRLAILPL